MTDPTNGSPQLRLRVTQATLVALDKRAKKSKSSRSDVARAILAAELGVDSAVPAAGRPAKNFEKS